jgi:SAM-dependent methyltransferase
MPTRASDRQVEFWDRVGPSKPFSHPVAVERLESLVAKDGLVLDYGCGYGRVLGILAERGFSNLVGIDIAPAMIASARRSHPNIRFEVQGDSERLPIADASVSAALLFAVLTCVPTDEGQHAIVRELGRVLAPGGILYVSDLWLQTDRRNLERYEEGAQKYDVYGVFDLPEGATVRHHSRAWIAELTRGFELVSREDIEMQTMNGHRALGFQWMGRRPAS